MVKRDAHIDVVFRNGLKELEVLPEVDLWDDIRPLISSRREAGYIFRVAAGIAAIVSLGLLAYFAGMQTSSSLSEAGLDSFLNNRPLLTEPLASNEPGSVAILAVPVNDVSESSRIPGIRGIPFQQGSVYLNLGTLKGMSITEFDTEKETGEILRNETTVPGEMEGTIPSNFYSVSLDPVLFAGADPADPEKWKVGAQISPTYLSSNLGAANKNLSDLGSKENASLSYSGGITVSYSIGNRLSLQAGVYYSSLGREISGITSYSGFTDLAGSKSGRVFGIETSSGTVNTTNRDIFLTDVSGNRIQSIYSADNFDPVKADLTPYGESLQQTFEYLEVPFIISFKVIDRKIDFNLMGGMSYNFLLENETYAVGDGGSKVLLGSTNDLNKIFLSSALGMNFEYSFAEKLSLSLGPSFRYYLNSGSGLSGGNPYTMGLYTGLFFKF